MKLKRIIYRSLLENNKRYQSSLGIEDHVLPCHSVYWVCFQDDVSLNRLEKLYFFAYNRESPIPVDTYDSIASIVILDPEVYEENCSKKYFNVN